MLKIKISQYKRIDICLIDTWKYNIGGEYRVVCNLGRKKKELFQT